MKAVFITGASKGIGKGIAQAFLDLTDFTIYNIARSNTIENERLIFLKTDLSASKMILDFKFPELEAEEVVLINNAGTLGELKHAGELSDRSVLESYLLNVVAPHVLLNKFIKQYKRIHGNKLIYNISSGAASSVYDGWSVYCASKSAINQMSLVVDLEQSLTENANRFKVFAIAPGVVETAMQEQLRNADESDFSRKEKFVELKENHQLYDAKDVGEYFVNLVRYPEQIDGVVSRISL